jgi:hypothetical protein
MLGAVQGRWLVILVVGCGFHSNASTGDARERDATTRDDAATDAAMIDATPGCSTAGLDCPAGQEVLITGCGTACWVGCTDGTPITESAARDSCTSWGGTLGSFASGTELDCVRAAIARGSAMWIGLEQAPGATTPQAGWSWISGAALDFTDWASGQPNDGDGSETDHAEQCAYSSTQTTWQDTPCTDLLARYACQR